MKVASRLLLFTTSNGGPIHPSNFHRRVWAPLLERLGLPHVPFGALRASAATVLLEEGVDISVVSELLGHSAISITAKHYAHVTSKLKRDAVRRLEGAFGK